MKNNIEFTASEFVDQFVQIESSLLNNNVEKKIHSNIRTIFYLSDETKRGDRYLYQSYIEIRISSFELPPWKLSKFVPV